MRRFWLFSIVLVVLLVFLEEARGYYGLGPFVAGSVDTYDARDVHVVGGYAYVADGYAGLKVIDVSDPTSPRIVGSVDTDDYADGVYVVVMRMWRMGRKGLR